MENSGMTKLIAAIRSSIEGMLDKGYKQFIIFPFGDVGIQVKHILNSAYGIQETYILDNHLYHYNTSIKPLSYMTEVKNKDDYAVLLSSTNIDIYKELKKDLSLYFTPEQIAELDVMKEIEYEIETKYHTKIGRYSYGPICLDHPMIESIGSFCSFAYGVQVVFNHEKRFLTTHPLIYAGQTEEGSEMDYKVFHGRPWCLAGVQPHKEVIKSKRSKIGNDVWLGHNVIITNGADIGNGVIAGAGAVITKNVPDYAIVVGVPAKIIKYRYSPEQISQLNKIKWWDWTDDVIRERYDDLYLPVDEFIKKYS